MTRELFLLKGIKAVIFDLDGTLVDSMWMWRTIDIEFLRERGHDCPDDLEIEGKSFSESAVYFKQRFQLKESLDEIKEIWIGMALDKYRYEVFLKPGVKEILAWLKEQKVKIGIATSNHISMVEVVLDSLEIGSYFDHITTGCEVALGKPAPDIYLEVARQLQVEPKECLVFEDVPAGVTAGVLAGMHVCAIEDEHSLHKKEELCRLAHWYVTDYFEFLNGGKEDA